MFRHCINFGRNQIYSNINFLSAPFGTTSLRNFSVGIAANKKEDSSDAFTAVSECDGIRVITLNNPRTCNALSMPMMESILKPLSEGWCDDKLRCIVINATGPIWSAGHDLKELAASSKSKQRAIFDKLTEIILTIQQAPVPVIASISGLAAAAGCQLASSCDISVASDNSSFSTPGVRFGIFCSTPGIALIRSMNSRSKAAYMLMTSLPISAAEALQSGLVTRVVPRDKLEQEVGNIIAAIKSHSRAVVAHGKEFFYEQIPICDLKEAYVAGANRMVENLQMSDGKEGLQSFVQKRAPVWKHK